MAICKTQALTLKTFDFRETSLIVNFYTRDFGKVSGLLKGIRTDPRKFASTLEPFSCNEIIFYRKRNDTLHLVSQCDLQENFNSLRNSIEKVTLASLMMELVDALVPVEDANADIFDLAMNCLKAMGETYDVDKIATIFKIKILALSGFKPHFDSCISCGGKVLGEAKFSVSLGGLICAGCFKKDVAARQIFRGTTATILHIERNDIVNNMRLGINPQINRELNGILRAFFDFHIEKRLKSQAVWDNLKEADKLIKSGAAD